MSDQVTVMIRGLEIFGRHGVFAAERELGQRFIVDLEMELSSCPAAQTDDIESTVDYASLTTAVAEIVAGEPVALLERLAAMIADRVMAEPLVAAVTIDVRKPHVALAHVLEETAVRLRRERP